MGEVRPGDGFRFTPFLAIVTAIVAAGAVWLVFNPAVGRQRQLDKEMRRLDAELAQLEQRRAGLQFKRNTLLYDSEALEREVRRQLGYVGPGEVALIPTAPVDVAAQIDAGKIQELRSLSWIRAAMETVLALLAASFAALAAGCLLEGRLHAG